jgi:hypothetical protein
MKFVMFQRHNFASRPEKCGGGDESVPMQITRFSTLFLFTFVPQAGKLTFQRDPTAQAGACLATAACCSKLRRWTKGCRSLFPNFFDRRDMIQTENRSRPLTPFESNGACGRVCELMSKLFSLQNWTGLQGYFPHKENTHPPRTPQGP